MGLDSYEEGLSIADARSRYGVTDVVGLASNESPYPPFPAVVEAVVRAAGGLNRYPDPRERDLRMRLGERFEFPAERIVVSNGANELLYSAVRGICRPGSALVFGRPSFSLYPPLAAASGLEPRVVPLDAALRYDLDALSRAIDADTSLVLVCNPNNPTGTSLPTEALTEFMGSVPRSVQVVIDQAYVEFQAVEDPDESISLVRRFDNVALVRTFSKVYALCGLRVGYALGSRRFRESVERARAPFNVNTLGQVAAQEALKHMDDVARRVEANAVERLWVEERLAEIGLGAVPSDANFSWIDLGSLGESRTVDELGRRGVIVRPGTALGDPGHIRVTFGTRPENERFVEAMSEIVAGLTSS